MSQLPLDQRSNEQPANDAGYAALMAVKPGERLKKERQKRKLDLDAAAAQLNLSVSVLRALEADDYKSLPSSTFIKGYIRSYARMLRLSGDDLVRAFEYQTGVHSSMDEQHPVPEAIKRKPKLGWYVVGLVVTLSGLGAYLFSAGDSPNSVAEPADPVITEQIAETTPEVDVQSPAQSMKNNDESTDNSPLIEQEPVDEVEEVVTESVPPRAQIDVPEVKVPPAPQSSLTTKSSAAPVVAERPGEALLEKDVVVSELPAPATESAANQSMAMHANEELLSLSEGKLTMRFSDDCWVEIRDANERLVHANLHRSGSVYSKTLIEPFDIKLGNGKAVKLSYNGNPVAVALSKRSNVANLSIGR